MNLRSIDLNLLVIFDALMIEKSITRAARTVGMTPSALSHALGRLRQTFNDPLVERTPRGMVPTPRAEALIPFVRAALQSLQRGIAHQLEFDPATSERSFNLRLSDFLSDCLLPRLCARVRAEAPGVTLTIGSLPDDAEKPYAAGDLQLRSAARVRGPEYRRQRLWRDPFVLAMRHGHPAADKKLTLAQFLELPYLDVSSATIDRHRLDEVLADKGLERRIVVTIPSLAGVVSILQHTDLCAILPKRWVELYSAPRGLATAALPLPGIEYAVDMVWHRRDDRDAGHRWLRTLIVQEFEALYAATVPERKKHWIWHRPSKLDVVPPLVPSD
jgi:DNA-binding transcriptional LysR family regulator